MTLQLVVFSLLTLFLMLIAQLMGPAVPAAAGQEAAGDVAQPRRARLDAVIQDTLRTYIFFAAYALMLFLLGKPDLLPQYLGWAVVMLQLLKGYAVFWERILYARFLGVVIVGLLMFLWILELPLLQAPPP